MAIQQSKTARIQMIRRLLLIPLLVLLSACHDKIETPRPTKPVERTVLMYFPWSVNLTTYFKQNIADIEAVVAQGALKNDRILVYFMNSETEAELFELRQQKNTCIRVSKKKYEPVPIFTTAAGIASILDDVCQYAPAEHYAMTIGCHGLAWLPVSQSRGRAQATERQKEYWEYESEGRPLTRWFGGTKEEYQTDITELAAGIEQAGMKMDYILFDDCYMASVEVAYALRHVTEHLIGSTCEVMAVGFPYEKIGPHLVGEIDYEAISQAFYDFYRSYQYPYGTISVTVCSELDALADVMHRINERYTFTTTEANLRHLQYLDGYSPVCFFDMGDYVHQLCNDTALLAEFEEQLERTVPSAWHRHTPSFYSMSNGVNPIRTYSGITISDPSINSKTVQAKQETEWWQATHSR